MIPVLHIDDGLLIDEKKRAFAILRVEGEDYGMQSVTQKMRQILSVSRGLREWIGEWYIYSLSLGMSAEQWRNKLPDFPHTLWQEHKAEANQNLQEQKPFTRAIYIAIPLAAVSVTAVNVINAVNFAKQAFTEVLAGSKQALRKFIPFDDLTMERLEHWHREKTRWLDRFKSFISVRSASLREIESWLRHGSFRGLVEPDSRMPKKLPTYVTTGGTLKPVNPAGVFLQDAEIDQSTFHLEAHHPDGQISYQSFFVALRVPAEIDHQYPFGNEWIYEVDTLNYPVDVALHVRVEDPREAMKKLRRKEKEAQNRENEYVENQEETPLELEWELHSASDLKRKLRDRDPLVHVKMIVGVGADSAELLHKRTKQIQSDLGLVQLVRAPGDQLRFWQAFYPFAKTEVPIVYETPMDPGILGAGVPFGASSFGDPSGFLLGYTYTNRAVFMNPTRPAMEMNRPPTILVSGTPGGGKTSFFAFLMSMLLSWGAKCFLNDPKGNDYDGLANLPFRTRFIRMEPGAVPFNPFRLGLEGAEVDLLDLLFNGVTESTSSNYRTVIISESLQIVRKQKKQDMFQFGRALQVVYDQCPPGPKKQEAEIMIGLFRAYYEDPLAHLFFGEDDGTTPADYDCTVVCTNYLTLPTDSEGVWSPHQRVSSALFYAVTAMGLGYFKSLPREVIKLFGLDEAWHYKYIPKGRELINKLMRESRALNIITALLMQNASDFLEWGESITGMFSWKFLLRQDSIEETKASLRIAGLPEEEADEWSKVFRNFRSGQGLVVDADGQINLMKIEHSPHRLLQVFSTTPTKTVKDVR